MVKSEDFRNRDAEFSNQLLTFKLNIGAYSTTLGAHHRDNHPAGE
jgi:hypothetical protein